MAVIKADNSEVEKVLNSLTHELTHGGGWLHPDLIIRERDGELSVEMERADVEGEKIILLNEDAILFMEDFDVTLKDGVLSCTTQENSNATDTQKKLMETMLELYNITDKIKHCEATDFWLNVSDKREIFDPLMKARTMGPGVKKLSSIVQGGLSEEKRDKFLIERYFQSRVLGWGGKTEEGRESEGKHQVLMTVIDFLNHHAFGARFMSPNHETLEVSCRQPVKGSNECYGFYGIMDALDTYLRYGFIDSEATVIRSVPLQIDIPNLGRIVVKSGMPAWVKKLSLIKPIQDLRLFMPAIQKKQDVITVSHLFIPVNGSPYALKRILGLCVAQLAGRPLGEEKHRKILSEAEAYVKEVNLKFYKDLRKTFEDLQKEQGESSPLTNALFLASLQEQKVESYECVVKQNSE